MSKKFDVYKSRYLSRCSEPIISFDTEDDTINAYIYTERFTAESIISTGNSFDKFEESLKELYNVTFNDPIAIKYHGPGVLWSHNDFEDMINTCTLRWQHNNPFSGFIIYDHNKENEVVGFAIIGDGLTKYSFLPNTGELSYIFNPAWHRSEKIQNVGYECIGAMVLYWGEYLAQNKFMVNQIFNHDNDKFEYGTPLKSICAKVRVDSIASCTIIENLGFDQKTDCNIFNYDRYFYKKTYGFDSISDEVQIVEDSLTGESI